MCDSSLVSLSLVCCFLLLFSHSLRILSTIITLILWWWLLSCCKPMVVYCNNRKKYAFNTLVVGCMNTHTYKKDERKRNERSPDGLHAWFETKLTFLTCIHCTLANVTLTSSPFETNAFSLQYTFPPYFNPYFLSYYYISFSFFEFPGFCLNLNVYEPQSHWWPDFVCSSDIHWTHYAKFCV